ncbi:MAG: TetR/AcrR family transcriptional regulator [Methyloceanibacter sp.]|uniref:TetR/AcrR family transcriptional regulator n=1 Tax=Methyloceanibacter sp. TaxID=1965321 RepID=UPI003D6CB7A0
MFDEFSKRSKAVRAALELAQQRDWGDITLADIAKQAGLDLADLRREFSCKSDIIRAFQAEVDAEVLAKAKPAGPDQSPRDRLFDIVMTRFEVLGPYKPALKRIACYLRCRPGEASLIACSTLASQYWMLAASGAKLEGPGAAVRVAGLASIYGKVFQVWLDDPSPSLDRTMAALDRRLSRGEQMLTRMEDACRFVCGLMPRGWKRKDGAETTPPPRAPEAGPAPAM